MNERILAAIRSQPWAILPTYLEAIEAIALRAYGAPALIEVAEDGHEDRHLQALSVAAKPLAGARSAAVRDGVGILPILGPIFPHANIMTQLSGATSLDSLTADLRLLQASPEVQRILLAIDSPGGAVTGISEFAGRLTASEKPVFAHVSGMGASAAYWIAAQAKEISADPTAVVGSIGVMMSSSVQEAPDRDGRREVSVISSSAPHKRPDLGSDEGQAEVRATLDGIEEVFIADVARGRGVTEATVRSEFGAGGTRTGKQGKAAGMVDRISTLEAAITRLATPARTATSRRTAAAQLEVARLRANNL